MPDEEIDTRAGDPLEQDAESGARTPRQRMRKALTPSWRQAVVGALLAVLGFAFVVQVRDTAANDTYAGVRESDLIQVLNGLNGTAARARREVDRLESQREDLGDENQARTEALDNAQQRLRTLNIIAGLVPVSGRGLRVTITESTSRVSVGSLLDTMQELRTAGAEAMELNDSIRIGANSSFENAGSGIELDDQVVKPPYVLDVIGDPRNLRTALTFIPGPIDTLQTFDGATVTVEELDSVQITSVREALEPEYAQFGTGQ